MNWVGLDYGYFLKSMQIKFSLLERVQVPAVPTVSLLVGKSTQTGWKFCQGKNVEKNSQRVFSFVLEII